MALERLKGLGYVDLGVIAQVVDPIPIRKSEGPLLEKDSAEPDWDSREGIAIITSTPLIRGDGRTTQIKITDPDDIQTIRDYCENPSSLEASIVRLRTQLAALAEKFSGGPLGLFGRKKGT